MRRLLLLAALAMSAALTAFAPAQAGEGVPRPNIVIERGEQCVADKETMRREHMDMLRHQRDKTMRQGVRTRQHSLNACIECHASKQNGSVLGGRDNFCQSCHAYAAVKIDCFDCHQARPGAKAEDGKPGAHPGHEQQAATPASTTPASKP